MPIYLQYGMTADQYWNGDPYLAVIYREKKDLEVQARNHELWLQGLYIYDAFSVVTFNMNRKKGQNPEAYPDKPYELKRPELEDDQEKRKKARADAIAQINALKDAMERKYGG